RTPAEIGNVPTTHFNIGTEHAQLLCDYVIDTTLKPGEQGNLSSVHYVNGFHVTAPRFYFDMPGHELEGRLRAAFPEFNRYPGGKLKRSVIEMVLGDLPKLAPRDVKDLFLRLMEERVGIVETD